MTILLVGAVVDSVQPSGHWAGTPATIVTLLSPPGNEATEASEIEAIGLYLDPRDYPFHCDPSREIPMSKLLAGRAPPETFARMGEATLWKLLTSRRGHHVTLAGTEPCEHQLGRLAELLHGSGRRLQIETRGRAETTLPDYVWMTLKPSPVREGNLDVLPACIERANEIIARIYRAADIDRLDEMLLSRSRTVPPLPVWLVPAGLPHNAYAVCVEAAAARKWRVMASS